MSGTLKKPRPGPIIRKIVSGGQTGVDRAALDAAIELGVAYGGWVPQGGRAEDFPKPPGLLVHYPDMREHPSRDWAPRTVANIKNTDATLVIVDGRYKNGPGTRLTIDSTKRLKKPLLIRDARDPYFGEVVEDFFLQFSAPIALNVAGSRGSSIPSIYDDARALIKHLIAFLETLVDG